LPSKWPHDALQAHARDELGITEQQGARPLLAAVASALALAAGAVLPLLRCRAAPAGRVAAVVVGSLVLLAGLGALLAHTGGVPRWHGAPRVSLWAGLAMACAWAAGALFGVMACNSPGSPAPGCRRAP
jgi:VIT1/CCC1 family predicted Fe2+/Mn2+ transporter